ncbi:hypothetical protein LIA77_06357 [Sarocladium implicatum]|nr:hypothetical protein LIA77_06357 [Sarocladium implicatum]
MMLAESRAPYLVSRGYSVEVSEMPDKHGCSLFSWRISLLSENSHGLQREIHLRGRRIHKRIQEKKRPRGPRIRVPAIHVPGNSAACTRERVPLFRFLSVLQTLALFGVSGSSCLIVGCPAQQIAVVRQGSASLGRGRVALSCLCALARGMYEDGREKSHD